jgi:hypothetical protein
MSSIHRADTIVVCRHAVDGYHIRMADSREEPRLTNQSSRLRITLLFAITQQLKRDLAFEMWVPGAIHLTEAAFPKPLNQREIAPCAQGGQWDRASRAGDSGVQVVRSV